MDNMEKLIEKVVTSVNLSALNYMPQFGNRTLMQYFEWYLPSDARHWNRAGQDAKHLAWLGVTDLWLPPAYKCHTGMMDVGYGVYDLYDLGEFYQKGTVPTKYGTKDEYLAAIEEMHKHGIRVVADMVLNHRMGADYSEFTYGAAYERGNRLTKVTPKKKLEVWTHFVFPGRNGKYSSFEWTDDHFSAVDYNAHTGSGDFIFKILNHGFSNKVAKENGNYDYLMGCNVDFEVPEVVEELNKWGMWYMDTTGADCVRLDAVKHISYDFFPQWLTLLRYHAYENAMKQAMEEAKNLSGKYGINFDQSSDEIRERLKDRIKGKEVFAVGEYWLDDLGELLEYLDNTHRSMTLFDVPLHHRFQDASLKGSSYDLRSIFDNTLLAADPEHAVTLVDNHDTQPGQALESWVQPWFKPLAYALILLRQAGTPCVFYGDLYGIPHNDIGPVRELENLMVARRRYAFGHQQDYFDHPNTIGWTREGAGAGGMAVVMSNGDEGWKDMALGQPGQVYVDTLGNRKDEVTINQDGWGRFPCNGGSVSVWVLKT